MKLTPHRKCLHCRRECTPDYRKRRRQKYCTRPDCRKAAKQASQRAWLTKPENQDYFRGPENTRRVQKWRLEHSEHRKPNRRQRKGSLQDSLKIDAIERQSLAAFAQGDALQGFCFPQHALFVGLMSVLTGQRSQEDIDKCIRSIVTRGAVILGQGK
jgi:hypothetical protein